jgi:hypothetical protein
VIDALSLKQPKFQEVLRAHSAELEAKCQKHGFLSIEAFMRNCQEEGWLSADRHTTKSRHGLPSKKREIIHEPIRSDQE